MTSAHSPLHFLAQVACDAVPTSPTDSPSPGEDVYIPDLHSQSRHSSTSSFDLVNLHIPCSSTTSTASTDDSLAADLPQPFRHSNASNNVIDIPTSPSRRKANKKSSHDASFQSKFKQQMRARRQLLMQKAMRIKSLDNSPVNDHQLHVLRMVYDQITMYPPESWMVLIAIVIRRAFKQVKNWFSNERQKNKDGRCVRTQTKEGDKVRLRPLALQKWCPQWSDAFFEEVIMIYDYKVLMDLRASDS
jgi:hypothetical protein